MNLTTTEHLKHILFYCHDIKEAMTKKGDLTKLLATDKDFYRSIQMLLYQIAEISVALNQGQKQRTKQIPWGSICKDMIARKAETKQK